MGRREGGREGERTQIKTNCLYCGGGGGLVMTEEYNSFPSASMNLTVKEVLVAVIALKAPVEVVWLLGP